MAKLLGMKELCEFWQSIRFALNLKVDKISGKGLSTNDYTTDEKNKLAAVGTQSIAGTTTGTQSVPHASLTTVKTLTLSAGTWLIIGQIDYAQGDTNGTYRAAWLGASPGSRVYAASEVAACRTGNVTIQAVTVQRLTAQTTVYLTALQGSGSQLNVNNHATYINAVKLAS